MTINAPASILLLLYELVAEEQGVGVDRAPRHGAERHPQGVRRARELHLPAEAVDAADDGSVRVLRGADPEAGTRSRSPGTTSARRESTAVQELAFTLANGIAYCRAAVDAGLVARRVRRAALLLLQRAQRLLQSRWRSSARRGGSGRGSWRERFGATNPKALALRFHAQTGGSTLTAQQPDNNIVRVAIQAFAAVCGGTQSLHTNAFDEALALPTRALRQGGAAHAADHRGRGRRARHRRSARRLLLHRGAHRRARGARLGADHARRRARRRRRRDRAGLRAGRDRAVGVRMAAAGRDAASA